MAQADRRLVPIVSIDVVAYSRLTEINERQTLRLVQRVYDRLVARNIGRYGGKVFKTMGDGLLAEFQSVVAAVEWVSDMQTELFERKLKVPGGGHFEVRAGIVLADVLVAGDDLYGSGVNLAVRVQAVCPPGGMAITKWMHQYLDGRSDLQFTDLGPVDLKNVSKTVRIYVWHPGGLAPAGAVPLGGAPRCPPSPTPLSQTPTRGLLCLLAGGQQHGVGHEGAHDGVQELIRRARLVVGPAWPRSRRCRRRCRRQAVQLVQISVRQ